MSSVRYYAFTIATIKGMNEDQLKELFSCLDNKTIAMVFGALCKQMEARLKSLVAEPEKPTKIADVEISKMEEEIKKLGY